MAFGYSLEEAIDAVVELEVIGFQFSIDGDDLHYQGVIQRAFDVLKHLDRVDADENDDGRRDEGPQDLQGIVAVNRSGVAVVSRPSPEAERGVHQRALHQEEDDRADPQQHLE